VSEIVVDGGRASGVRLADGTVVPARVVLSGADPKTTFLRLVPPDTLDPAFVQRVREWRSPGCVLKVNLALSEAPRFPDLRGTIEIAPSIDYLHAAWEDAAAAGFSRRPFMEVFVQSAVDPTLVDGGGHVVSAFTQYVTEDADVSEATEAVLDTLASYSPGLRETVVACDALGPRELEARFGLWGGNIFHGEITPEQCFGGRFGHRTPVPGLYLCGSGARPGGGVMGAAGRNAAKVVVRDVLRDDG
jgi:phytoene dehydrogenase-like protein